VPSCHSRSRDLVFCSSRREQRVQALSAGNRSHGC
jgi:hypothetical protein